MVRYQIRFSNLHLNSVYLIFFFFILLKKCGTCSLYCSTLMVISITSEANSFCLLCFIAGPMLSSGMCREVFQFDASPSPGAIIPASSVTNITAEDQQNATNHNKGKSRRILRGLPIPLAGSNLNVTAEHVGSSQKDNFQGHKSVSPMVVSVLVDPREAGDSEVDGVIAPKSISRIFVVVLIDSVKYATYSCVLPRSGPHLVTT